MAEYQVAQIGEIPPGKTKIVLAGNKEVVICNVGNKYFCIDNVCTHDGGPLGEGELQGEIIECPRHGAQFDVSTGAVVSMPAVVPVATFPVKIQGDKITVVIQG